MANLISVPVRKFEGIDYGALETARYKNVGLSTDKIVYGSDVETKIGATAAQTAADNSITLTAHGLKVNDAVFFSAEIEPTNILANRVYYVKSVISADKFSVSDTLGGTEQAIAADDTVAADIYKIYGELLYADSIASARPVKIILARAVARQNHAGNTIEALSSQLMIVTAKKKNGVAYTSDNTLVVNTDRIALAYDTDKEVQATATATIDSDAVDAISVNVGGGYYDSVPAVSFSGGGGTGAAATAVLTDGVVTSINVTAGGSGYTSAPTVTVAAPSGSTPHSTWTLFYDASRNNMAGVDSPHMEILEIGTDIATSDKDNFIGHIGSLNAVEDFESLVINGQTVAFPDATVSGLVRVKNIARAYEESSKTHLMLKTNRSGYAKLIIDSTLATVVASTDADNVVE